MRKKITLALKLGFTVLLLGWLLRRTDVGLIGAAMRGAAPGWIAAALVTQAIGILLSVWRWQLLLRIQGAGASLGSLTRSYLVGIFFNNFLPSTVGGDIVRARDTAASLGSWTRAVTVIMVERMSGIFALGLFALAAPVFGVVAAEPAGSGAVWIVVGGLLGLFAACLALLRPGLLERGVRWCSRRGRAAAGGGGTDARRGPVAHGFEKCAHLLETLEIFARNPRSFRTTFLLGLLLQADVILHFWCLSESLGFPVPGLAYFLIIPVMAVVLLLPVSINGIGAREAVFVFFLGRYGIAMPEAIAYAWIAYAIVLVPAVLGGLLYALRRSPGPGVAGSSLQGKTRT